ncbi:GNAT family N-acetyltransferase [Oceanobacillus kimchii]|uniref:Acetyltransferase n=1 Tax=Oceanobacillus kimchii TaxID=746691 RepID=A0ABQ5THG3_9BACI|nr:GNAT family N-acetyltransferase [Oceanobacillus kimchii]GLO65701.1 acetyltransferase [Oceanobacillus kimchii]
MRVRKALLEDVRGIAIVHVDSWKDTYKGIIPDSYLEKLTYQQREQIWESNISEDKSIILVAENEQGKIIGFASGGKRSTNTYENAGDLTSLYLLETYQGTGIGKQLLREVLLHLEELGYRKVFVEVLEDNRTRYFYEYYGAILTSSSSITIGGKVLSLLIYEWKHVSDVLHSLSGEEE